LDNFHRRFLPNPLFPDRLVASAFRPTPGDLDGISISRVELPNAIRRVLADTRRKPEEYSVCQFDLIGLIELTVIDSPTTADPGHASIPEIAPPYEKLLESDERKMRIRAWTAELVRRSAVVHSAGTALPDIE
jgi:hypothetical protein